MNNYFTLRNMFFAYPHFLWLLLLIPLLIGYKFFIQKNKPSAFLLSSITQVNNIPTPAKIKLRPLLFILPLFAIANIIIALARPQASNINETINGSGIDIMLSMDISGSMLAEDFTPNRLEAGKTLAADFVTARPNDRMGLVIFSGESFSQCPLTTDVNILLAQIKNIQCGMLQDGTAIGMGLATAVDRLKDSKAKSKIIILLTDGVNNTGLIDPITALAITKAYHIKVYTIGIGTMGKARMPVGKDAVGNWVFDNVPVEIDEKLMQQIATETGGKYYRCTDNNSLAKVYKEIDKLEKSDIEINSFKKYKELFYPFVLLAILALLAEMIIQKTVFKSITE